MSNHQGDGVAGTGPNSSQTDSKKKKKKKKKKNTISDVRNQLGFLLAGFGAVISFLGLRSAEVTTVLRNDPGQASLIALVLLVGVLAAVLTVATERTQNAPLPSAAAIVLMLFGAGALVIHAIPIGEPSGTTLSLVLGLATVSAGIIILVISTIITFVKQRDETTAGSRWRRYWLLEPIVPLTVILLLASVILIAISAYGAMRLETDSQLSFSVQVAGSVTKNPSGTTVSVHVTAFKLKNGSWVGIRVTGLPNTFPLAVACSRIHTGPNTAPCPNDPCAYLQKSCQFVMGGTLAPDAEGDVNEVLSTPIMSDMFQQVSVQAEYCEPIVGCSPVIDSGSRLDLTLPKS
jgi:hypothetical protein